MNKKESKTLNYYDGIAKGYKTLYHEEQIKKINQIKQHLPEKGNILDLGSGDGVLNQFLSKNVHLISLDLSFKLLKLNPNKNKILASILNLPIKSSSIDFISSFTVFQDLPNPTKAIEETHRVLKQDGTLILSFLNMSQNVPILIEQINKNFQIIKQINDEKDYIFVLKKTKN